MIVDAALALAGLQQRMWGLQQPTEPATKGETKVIEVDNPTQRIKPVLDELFKFKIGDVVAFAIHEHQLNIEADLNGQKRDYDRMGAPRGLIIKERNLIECHGGVQKTYTVTTPDGVPGQINEFELVPYAEAVTAIRRMRPNKPVAEGSGG